MYAVGSFALDGYEPGRSDLDVIAVVRGALTPAQKHSIVGAVRHESLPVPARGLELVVYAEDAVRRPSTAAAYELDLNTGERMPFRAAFDADRPDRHWFAIDRAIARDHGIALFGPTARDVFAAIPRDALVPLLRDSLEWYRANESSDAAFLNTCRVWRYVEEGVWSSKPAAAAWAAGRIADELRRR